MVDLLIIGGGPGGVSAALTAAKLGKRVVLFEGREIGGTCLNRGCIPTKTLLHAANLLTVLREEGAGQGVLADAPRWDAAALSARRDQVVTTLRSGMEQQLKSAKVEVVAAYATVTGPNCVTANGVTYEGAHILLATGAAPALPPIPGLELPGVLTSDGLLNDLAPKESLVILGGGVIGMEMAALWCALGAKVTVLEAGDRILFGLDRELGQSLVRSLKVAGVEILTGVTVTEVAQGEGGLAVSFTYRGGLRSVCAPTVLVATGRRPVMDGLFDMEPPATDRGFFTVDSRYRTSMTSILAIGDAIGGVQLAHKAEAQGVAAVCALYNVPCCRGTAPIPACVYTEPEIASVGLTADEAKARGIPVRLGKCLMGGNGRTIIDGGKRGFVRLVFHEETEVILGAQLLCSRATDLISELTLAVTLGLTRAQLLLPVRPHPTFAEAITAAAEAAGR